MPKSIKVLGKRYKIKITDKFPDGFKDCEGCIWFEKATIYISKKTKNPMQVLLHEMIHAILDRSALYTAGLSPEIEELICDTIATVFTENFKIDKIK